MVHPKRPKTHFAGLILAGGHPDCGHDVRERPAVASKAWRIRSPLPGAAHVLDRQPTLTELGTRFDGKDGAYPAKYGEARGPVIGHDRHDDPMAIVR